MHLVGLELTTSPPIALFYEEVLFELELTGKNHFHVTKYRQVNAMVPEDILKWGGTWSGKRDIGLLKRVHAFRSKMLENHHLFFDKV